MTPHELALAEIRKHIFDGPIQEIVPFGGCCFGELKTETITADEFRDSPCEYYPTRILHILAGHGVPWRTVGDCLIRKAYHSSTRVLILEHLPGVEGATEAGFAFAQMMTAILSGIEINLADRNVLFVLTNLKGWDGTRHDLNAHTLKNDIPFIEGAGRDKYDCLLFSSERQPDGRLLTREDAGLVAKSGREIWCVCGGLMFLNLMAEVPNRPITLVDISAKQLLYAHAVVETIQRSPTLEDFDRNLDNPLVHGPWPQAIEYLQVDQQQCEYWYNLVRAGHWRERYTEVRDSLDIHFHHGPLDTAPIPKDAMVYTSTVEPGQYANIKNLIIEAFSERDIPYAHGFCL